MRRVNRSALVPHSQEQMFDLVADVGSYPDFLPWCQGAQVNNSDGEVVEATLAFGRGGLHKSFRTRNTLRRPESITLQLLEGPFRRLSGAWAFQGLGNTGTKVALDLEFEFENRMTDFVLGPFFEEICNSLVDAFTRRARQIHGGGKDV